MTGAALGRDLRRLTSVPAPWVLQALALGVAVSTSVALAALGSAPSSAASLSVLPAVCGLLGALTVGADIRFGCLHTELLLLGGRRAYVIRTARAVAVFAAATGGVTALTACGLGWFLGGSGGALDAQILVVVGGVAVAVTWSLIGVAGALVAGSQTLAVASLLGYLLLAEPLLEGTWTTAAHVLPGAVAATVLAGGDWAAVAGGAVRLGMVVLLAFVVSAVTWWRRPVPVTPA